ncbi:MAG: DUF2085 domain-containing protein [Pyrinomonadaceae bacterium]
MPELASDYLTQKEAARQRTQPFRVWLAAAFLVAVWVALIIMPALFLGNGVQGISGSLYSFFGYVCHQIPERSLHLFGHKMAVCSRCFGVYFGLLFGLLIYPLWRKLDDIEPLPRFWLFLSLVPIGVDWSLGVFGIWENTHASRFFTGAILGVACAVFIIPALVEIVRNLTRKRHPNIR